VGAETGVPGLLLLLGLFAWAFAARWIRQPNAVTSLAAVALGALGVQACVDCVLHFPAVPIAAAALVGTGQGFSKRRTDEGLSPDDG
jgi:hypothetical protein